MENRNNLMSHALNDDALETVSGGWDDRRIGGPYTRNINDFDPACARYTCSTCRSRSADPGDCTNPNHGRCGSCVYMRVHQEGCVCYVGNTM